MVHEAVGQVPGFITSFSPKSHMFENSAQRQFSAWMGEGRQCDGVPAVSPWTLALWGPLLPGSSQALWGPVQVPPSSQLHRFSEVLSAPTAGPHPTGEQTSNLRPLVTCPCTSHPPPLPPSLAAEYVSTIAKLIPSFCASSSSSWAGMLQGGSHSSLVPYGGALTWKRLSLGTGPSSVSHDAQCPGTHPLKAIHTPKPLRQAKWAAMLVFPDLHLLKVFCRWRAPAQLERKQQEKDTVLSTITKARQKDGCGGSA